MSPAKYIVIDAEFHHIPPEAAAEAARRSEQSEEMDFRSAVERPGIPQRRLFDIESEIDHMNKCGVDMALVATAPWVDPGVEVSRLINDGLARVAGQYPGRFIPMAHVPYILGQPAIDELERAVSYLGFKGVTVMTSYRGIRLDDPRLRPFFKRVSQLHIPIKVHPTVKTPIWGGDRYFLSGSVSREYDIIKSFVEVMMGVLPEFPDLNFIFAHYGGGVPFLLGRIMSWYSPKGAAIPEEMIGVPRTIKEFKEYGLKRGFDKLLDRMYYTMAGVAGWAPAFKAALGVIKPERLCFATDYPYEMRRPDDLKAYIASIKRASLPEKDKTNILGGNIKRLFKV